MQHASINHIWINGICSQHLSVMDRGLHYGDGLFETIACVNGKLQFWHEHLARMRTGASRLRIAPAAIENFEHDVQTMLQQHGITDGVIKLMLTRGQSERGYRSATPQKTTRIVILTDLPKYPDEYMTQGINACFCQHPVSTNAQLAGIKHLNRLDNVLARNEWQDEYQEGFMCDAAGHVIEGTMSNIFAAKNNQLFTPSLNHGGVDGIIRAQILALAQQQGIDTHIAEIKKEQLITMDEIFITNSLIGLWPVSTLAGHSYQPGPISRQLHQALQQRMAGK